MWEFLETIGGKVSIISASVIGIITILEKFTSLKIWTWLKKKKQENLEKKFKPITDKIDSLTDLVEVNRVKEIKYQILDFEHALLMDYDDFNLAYFNNIESIIDEYEQKYKDKHNGEIKSSIQFIRKAKKAKKQELLDRQKEQQAKLAALIDDDDEEEED